MNKILLLTSGVLLSVLSTWADDNSKAGLTPKMLRPDFTNLTPEAASLGKSGSFQVSEYSGNASISIPLYTGKSGSVSLPISLNYDGSGIKVEQDATMVGLGWNISYGGMISHIICGEDDFRETTGYTSYCQNYWKGKFQTVPKDQPCQSLEFINHQFYVDPHGYDAGWGPYHEDQFSLHDRISRGYDTPDVFQASFCGHNVSFIIEKRIGTESNGLFPVVVLDDNANKYKISYKMDLTICGNKYPSSFTITDDKGISFEFSAYSENVFSNEHKDSYYLTKVYGPDGANGKSVITIEYDQSSTTFFGSGSRIARKNHQSSAEHVNYNKNDMPNANDPAFENQNNRLVGKIKESYSQPIGCDENGYSYKVYPKKISTAQETIVFNLGNRDDLKNAKCISSVIITSKANSSTRRIDFSYGYFYENTPLTGYSGKRLQLTGVTIDDQKYKFEYDSQKLPAFSSYSKDYWGYYNGANPNDSKFIACTPAYSISTTGMVSPIEHLDGSNRLASEKMCNVGMLKKVIYPTGGYTQYEYEIHRFNDKYYYPDANNSKIAFPMASSYSNSLNLHGTMLKKETFKSASDKLELVISGILKNTSDKLIVKVSDSSSGKLIGTFSYNGVTNPQISATNKLSLTIGNNYTIEAELTASASSGSSTLASCTYKYEVANPNNSTKAGTSDENGGYSIGGGLRIKTIKNYDYNGTYLNGVKYEYNGGKLLCPTVQLEKHYVDLTWMYICWPAGDPIAGYPAWDLTAKFSFNYANTEPSYLFVCSMGIPATVGYDQVSKNEIDKNGNVLRKTVLDFHNYGYITEDGNTNAINSRMQNVFFFNSYYSNNPAYTQGHLNGKIKKETRYSDKGTITYAAGYSYECVKQGSVVYPKCFPNFIPGLHYYDAKFDLAFYRKFIAWSYLTGKTETLYDNNGKVISNTTSSYSYNPSNYQVSEQKASDGQNTSLTHYYYPMDGGNKSSGLSNLTSKHIIGELTSIDTYKNNKFVGGSRYDFTLNANLPVVNKCYSILPNSSKTPILEMNVTAWDGHGNIREYKQKNGTPVTVLWSYDHRYPVMEIAGKTYSEILAVASSSITSLESLPINGSVNGSVQSLYDSLKNNTNLKDAYVTSIIYDGQFNVACVMNPNGYTNYYNRDSFGRLSSVVDPTRGILQRYDYNYKNK